MEKPLTDFVIEYVCCFIVISNLKYIYKHFMSLGPSLYLLEVNPFEEFSYIWMISCKIIHGCGQELPFPLSLFYGKGLAM